MSGLQLAPPPTGLGSLSSTRTNRVEFQVASFQHSLRGRHPIACGCAPPACSWPTGPPRMLKVNLLWKRFPPTTPRFPRPLLMRKRRRPHSTPRRSNARNLLELCEHLSVFAFILRDEPLISVSSVYHIPQSVAGRVLPYLFAAIGRRAHCPSGGRTASRVPTCPVPRVQHADHAQEAALESLGPLVGILETPLLSRRTDAQTMWRYGPAEKVSIRLSYTDVASEIPEMRRDSCRTLGQNLEVACLRVCVTVVVLGLIS